MTHGEENKFKETIYSVRIIVLRRRSASEKLMLYTVGAVTRCTPCCCDTLHPLFSLNNTFLTKQHKEVGKKRIKNHVVATMGNESVAGTVEHSIRCRDASACLLVSDQTSAACIYCGYATRLRRFLFNENTNEILQLASVASTSPSVAFLPLKDTTRARRPCLTDRLTTRHPSAPFLSL